MNLLTEEQFNAAMQSPKQAAEFIRLLTEDLGICIAIIGGPNANDDLHKELIRSIARELIIDAEVARNRINAHLEGKATLTHRIILPT